MGGLPEASSLQEVGTRWRKGCRRRSWCAATRPVQSGLGTEGTTVLATATRVPGASRPAPCPVMTLQPSLLPLCLLPLLLLSGVVCQDETGSETESPVRTLQVETLVRRLSWSTGAGPSAGIKGLKEPASRGERKYGN